MLSSPEITGIDRVAGFHLDVGPVSADGVDGGCEDHTAAPSVFGRPHQVVRPDSRRNRHLVAAIEIVSPSNEDRPENRATFISKMATLLRNNVCVSIIDVVSTCDFNLYADLMGFLHGVDPALGSEPPPMSAATLRMRHEDRRRLMDNWYHPLAIGQPLPTLPIWLKETWAISLDLESRLRGRVGRGRSRGSAAAFQTHE
jgi:hypothetical protein